MYAGIRLGRPCSSVTTSVASGTRVGRGGAGRCRGMVGRLHDVLPQRPIIALQGPRTKHSSLHGHTLRRQLCLPFWLMPLGTPSWGARLTRIGAPLLVPVTASPYHKRWALAGIDDVECVPLGYDEGHADAERNVAEAAGHGERVSIHHKAELRQRGKNKYTAHVRASYRDRRDVASIDSGRAG